MQNAAPRGAASDQLGSDRVTPTKSAPTLQPDSVCQLQALHLIADRHVRPEMATTLAGLAFGGAA